MISGGRKEADLLSLKECIFGKHKCTIFSPFSAKVYTYIRFWGLQGGSVPLPIGKFCICKLNTHNFRPFFGLNLQKYIISGAWSQGAVLLFIRECVFRGTILSKFPGFIYLRRLVKMTKPFPFENKSLRLKYKCLICI